MTYRVHIKTAFMELELREILQSPPDVLLGVSADAASMLAAVPITTVYDLALARMFRDATHLVEAATDPTSVVARYGHPPADLIAPQHAGDVLADVPEGPVSTLAAVTPELAAALAATLGVTSVRDLAQWPPYLAAVTLLTEALAPERAAG